MASPISIYLSDSSLRMLDDMVEKQATLDRAAGLEGRQITSRSKLIDRLIAKSYDADSAQTIESIRYHVIELAESYGAEKVSLFGSYARGDSTSESDVDILLEKGDIHGMKVLDFQEDLEEKLGCKVDVVTTEGATERFLKRIEKEVMELYKREVA